MARITRKAGPPFGARLVLQWHQRASRALPWTIISYVVLMAGGWALPRWILFARHDPLLMAFGTLAGCVVFGVVWTQANRRWSPVALDPSPSGQGSSVWGWMLWALLWLAGVWGLIGFGYTMHRIWGDTMSFITMAIGSLILFGSLSVFGTVAGAYNEAPSYRWMIRRLRQQPHQWGRVLAGALLGDAVVLIGIWITGHGGMIGWGIAGMLAVGWSILEPLSVLLIIGPEASRRSPSTMQEVSL